MVTKAVFGMLCCACCLVPQKQTCFQASLTIRNSGYFYFFKKKFVIRIFFKVIVGAHYAFRLLLFICLELYICINFGLSFDIFFHIIPLLHTLLFKATIYFRFYCIIRKLFCFLRVFHIELFFLLTNSLTLTSATTS
jgi:hypothetical protein